MGIKKKNKFNRLKGMICYESGPMDRVKSWDDATQWRNDLKPFLFERGVGVLDPCDKATTIAIEDQDVRKKKKLLKEQGRYDELAAIMKPICAIDLRMVDICGFVILYIDIDSHMAGSYHEATVAIGQKKPVLIVCKQGKENIPDWWWGVLPHSMMFSNWDELKNYLDYIDTAENAEHEKRWRFLNMDYVYGTTT